MNDEALRAAWTSTQSNDKETLMATLNAVLAEDRAAQEKNRWTSLAALSAMALLCPALLWCAAYGKTPLVRGGYALMAVGTFGLLLAEWTHRNWSRQALPGPNDTRSHLQRIALVLSRQAQLFRTAPLWCTPIFMGAALIGAWLFEEQSHNQGYFLWAALVAGWLMSAVAGFAKSRELDERRSRIEGVLSDLQ